MYPLWRPGTMFDMDAPTNRPGDTVSSTRWAMPTTASGRGAGALALLGVAALLGANLVFEDATGVRDMLRVACIVVFMASGVGALVLSVRALRQSDRSFVAWLALVFGALATALTIAELTILE